MTAFSLRPRVLLPSPFAVMLPRILPAMRWAPEKAVSPFSSVLTPISVSMVLHGFSLGLFESTDNMFCLHHGWRVFPRPHLNCNYTPESAALRRGPPPPAPPPPPPPRR